MTKAPAQITTDMTYKALQAYVWQTNIDRGVDLVDPSKKLVLLMEEVGEVARAIRKSVGMGFTNTTKTSELGEELADVQILLLGLASMMDVDMVKAVADKEDKNKQRVWK